MNLESILNRLPANYKTFLDDRKEVLFRTATKIEVKGEIRGYLAALRISNIIQQDEFMPLYLYYTSEIPEKQ